MSNNKHITWNDINWVQTQTYVRKVQHRIYKARINGDIGRVHWLQKFIINNIGAKLIAVRQVTILNKGRKNAGIDKQIIITPEQKIQLARELTLDGKSMPIQRVWIPKPQRIETCPLGILAIQDRAKQALAKLALEPEWEAIFEANSYGYRPGRCPHDAIEAIFLSLHHNIPKYVYDADIRKCFDKINHDVLIEKLHTFPIMKKQIAAWLKSSVMESYVNNPKSEITFTSEDYIRGGVIAPLLANIALHGLENHIKEYAGNISIKPYSTAGGGKLAKMEAVSIIRYADDFVIIHPNKEILKLCINEVKNWLRLVGLEINENKSSIKDVRNGFLFLGFQIIQLKKITTKRYKVKIQPSKPSQMQFLSKIRTVIQNNKASSSYLLITKLRPIIIGWANYFRYCECKKVFIKLSHLIFQKLRAWAFRRDQRNGRLYLKQKYFPSGKTYNFDDKEHKNNWILTGKQKTPGNSIKHIYLPNITWIRSKKYIKIKGSESPFSMSHYWNLRTVKEAPYPMIIRKLLIKQKETCPICKYKLTTLDSSSWEIGYIIPKCVASKDTYENLQLLHIDCHLKKTKENLLKYKPKNKTKKPLNLSFNSKSFENLQEPDETKVSRPDLKTRKVINDLP